MKSIFICLGMLGSFSFFILLASLSIDYKGVEESNFYIVYSLLIMAAIFFYSSSLFNRLAKSEFYIFVFLFFLVSSHIAWLVAYGGDMTFFNDKFVYFILWSLPAVLSAMMLYHSGSLEVLDKKIDFLFLFLFFSVLNSVIIPTLFLEGFSSFGGETYQTASYISSLGFGLAFYLLLFSHNHNRYSFFINKYYKFFLFFSLFVFLAGVIIPGGRGAFVLLVIYSLFFLFKLLKTVRSYFYVFIAAVFSFVLIRFYFDLDIFLPGFNRATAFIDFESGGVVNWEGSSGRDAVYVNAISKIIERPIFGYGFFSVESLPHNIFLEVLFQGGFLYLFFFLCFLSFILLKINSFIYYNKKYSIFLVFYIFSLVSLMFSGSYIYSGMFWFLNTYFYLLITGKKYKKSK